MTNKFFHTHTPLTAARRGFTLIELLVVVLIIGILSAVALPQYEQAVRKARLMRLTPLMQTVNTAQQVYYLANNEYSPDLNNLDIELPSGAEASSATGFTYQDFVCFLQGGNGPSVYCYDRRYVWPKLEKYYARNYFLCWDGKDDAATKLCKSLSGKTTADGVSSGDSLGNYWSF